MCDHRDEQQEKTAPLPANAPEEEEIDESINWPELRPVDHFDQFDSKAYLDGFYTSPREDGAMKIVLFFLPGTIYRIPVGGTLLDLGAGPTVYVPMMCRRRVDAIYTSDFAPNNRDELRRWWQDEPEHFDWSAICTWIGTLEASGHDKREIEKETRAKIRAVLAVNVHNDESVIDHSQTFPANAVVPKQFDIIATIFCLEYASETLDQYKTAVRNALKLLKPGGTCSKVEYSTLSITISTKDAGGAIVCVNMKFCNA